MSDWQPPQPQTGATPAPGSYPPPPPGPAFAPPGEGYPPPSQGYPPPGQGYPPPSQGYPPPGQGYPPPSQGYPPPGQGYPPPGPGYGPPGGGFGGPPFAGFGARLGAYLIDGLIGAIPVGLAVGALVGGPRQPRRLCTVNNELKTCAPPSGVSWTLFSLLLLAGVAFTIWNHVIRQGKTGQTIGKGVVGIKLVDKANGAPLGSGRAFVRYLVEAFASGLCALGFLWMLWDLEKQTWHDKVANSYVITA